MEIEKLIKSLYEDKALGEIPKDVYTDLMDKYSKEKAETISENEILEDRINSNESQKIDIDKFIMTIKNYMELGTIDRNFLIRLIDHIFIHETEIINGKKSQKVSIHYNFIGSLD